MREQNWERKGPALHVSRYNSSTSALASEWDSIFLDHWGMDIGGIHTPWNEGHSLSESACRESGIHWWRKQKSILLTHTFQTGNSNFQMRMLQKKKNPKTQTTTPPRKKTFSHVHPLPSSSSSGVDCGSQKYILQRDKEKNYSGTISAHSYSFETCPRGKLGF